MSEYTSTLPGFQRAMEWSLTGPPSEAAAYVQATTTPTFYHVMNDVRTDDLELYTKGIAEWRGKVGAYEPVVYASLPPCPVLSREKFGCSS